MCLDVFVFLLLTSCATPTEAPLTIPTRAVTPTAQVVALVLNAAGPTITPAPTAEGSAGIRDTLANYRILPGDDADGAKTAALRTLINFGDPKGPYAGAWWLSDGQGDLYEALAILFYTEGNTNLEVRKAVAARYIWYCGGQGPRCSGPALINFLAYFQPWRAPETVPGGFTRPAAIGYLELAREVVNQQPGLLTEWIPGADQFTHSPDSYDIAGPVAWAVTPFHFANVHPTWDEYLRRTLGRGPNGPHGLWVLTMGEAARVCGSYFVCSDMTREKTN